MSSRSQDDGWIIILVVLSGLLVLATWKFSKAIGVDINTGAEVLYKTIIYLVIFIAGPYLLRNIIGIKNTILILFPFSVFCITPILDFKAKSNIPDFITSTYASLPWWGTGWGQFLIFIILSGISAIIWYITRDN